MQTELLKTTEHSMYAVTSKLNSKPLSKLSTPYNPATKQPPQNSRRKS